MAVSIELTKEYGYVVLVLVAYVFLNLGWASRSARPAESKLSEI